MAVAASIVRREFNSGFGGWVNLWLSNTTGILTTTPLTITSAASPSNIGASGPLVVTPYQELPNFGYKCRITTAPVQCKNYLLIKIGDTVTG